jgi:POT family proton-dependent oligopeptide transporter
MATSYPEEKKVETTDTPAPPYDASAPKKSLERTSSIQKESYDSVSGTDIVEGSEGVTYDELHQYRHVADRLPWTSWVVVFVEFAERWTYYGTVNVYNNYIRFPLPPGSTNGSVPVENRQEGVAGALDMGVKKSFAIRTFATLFTYLTPLVGGIVADVYWGRFKTIIVFSFITILGHVILVISSTPQVLAKAPASLILLIVSILVNGLGTGGIKSNVSPLVAEQYTGKLRKETLPSGEIVIKSPPLTIQSVYMWFYAAINFGSCGAISASFLARDHGYWVAYLVPTCIMFLVPGVLALAKKNYVVTPPRGSILLETLRVIGMCLGPAWSINPLQTIRNVKADTFWDAARPSTYSGKEVPSRITWDEEFVGEVSRTVSAVKVFFFFPIYWLCYSQIDGNLGTMAGSMTLRGTPNDLIQNLNPITLIILIPIFDFVIYPTLRKYKINFSPLKRITFGFIVAGLAMVYAAVLQHYLYETSPCHDFEPSACVDAEKQPLHSPLNVWIVSGPYIMVAISEIFASITSLEYAFTKAPVRMKSVVMAFAQIQTAFSSALNLAMADVNEEQKFMWLFTSVACVTWAVAGLFFWLFKDLDAREDELNQIGQGERRGFKYDTAVATRAPE